MENTQKKNMHGSTGAVTKIHFSDFVIVLIIGILSLTCVIPFWHVLAKSISSNAAVAAKQVSLWPVGVTMDAYKSLFEDGSMTRSMVYSLGVTALFTLMGMIVCICASYPLSKKRLKGRGVITFLLMIPMYFSAGLLPTYLLYSDLRLLDNMWVLILPLIYSSYNMLIMKNYFMANIPDELEESAFLDGASNFTVLFRIVLPLSMPILATLTLFYAVGRWNAYSDNLYYIRSSSLKMVQYKLYEMVLNAQEAASTSLTEATNITSTPEVLQSASVMFVTIPIIIVYPFVQKFFVKGIMVGAVKG